MLSELYNESCAIGVLHYTTYI